MDISDRKGLSASGLPSARGRLRRTSILALLLAIAPIRVFAQDGLFDYQEYEKRVKSAQGLTAISADAVFGDRTSSFDGSTDFYVEDVSLPGNFDLPVSVARRFGVESVNRAINGSEATGLTLFDDWEIEVPHLSGVWTNATGWVTSTGGALTTQRCTANTAPLVIDGHGYDNIGFGIDVKWVKGASEQLLVPDDLNYASAPGLEDPKWITTSKARFTCLSSTRNGYPGEGFIGYTPDGKKYFFDWGVEKPYAVAKYSDGAASRIVNRKRVYLLASRIEDRFGNWVTYSYTGYRLNSIEASDGRLITLTYDGQGRVKTVSANGRVWNYAYAEATNSNDAGLAKVTLPDGSSWAYSHSGRLQSRAPYRNAEDSGVCSNAVGSARPPTQMVVNAPTGAKGVFDFEMTLFIRNPEACEGPQPPYYDMWSLKRRTITGPGLSTMVTSWAYDARPAGDTARGRWVSRLQPDGVEVRERFSVDPRLDERKLLQRQVLNSSRQVMRDEQWTYVFGSDDGPFPKRIGRSLAIMGGQLLDGTLSALSESTIYQDGDTYRSSFSGFDRYARATSISRTGPSGTRSEQRDYHNSATPWVVDQILKVTEPSTGKITYQYSYDALAKPIAVWRAGKLQQEVDYAADGNIARVRDGLARETRIENWYRGVPRLVTNPDGTTNRMTVDDNGWITSTTDELGLITGYSYDSMGRVHEVQPPIDDNQWQKTVINFSQTNAEEYGLPGGHWRTDTIRGNLRQETYHDALWQPVLTREYDNSDPVGTQRFVRKAFDTQGRVSFNSYPSSSSNAASGMWLEYDALGRKISSGQDSEQGLLVSTQSYTTNATVVATDPRGYQSITRFEGYDAPDYQKPAQIIRADGSKVTVKRNLFGLPTEVAQSSN